MVPLEIESIIGRDQSSQISYHECYPLELLDGHTLISMTISKPEELDEILDKIYKKEII